jgi:hypothetical protein
MKGRFMAPKAGTMLAPVVVVDFVAEKAFKSQFLRQISTGLPKAAKGHIENKDFLLNW